MDIEKLREIEARARGVVVANLDGWWLLSLKVVGPASNVTIRVTIRVEGVATEVVSVRGVGSRCCSVMRQTLPEYITPRGARDAAASLTVAATVAEKLRDLAAEYDEEA